MPKHVFTFKQILLDVGIDLASIGGLVAVFLPFVQTALGVVIAVVILLINVERYKKIRRENSKHEEKEKN